MSFCNLHYLHCRMGITSIHRNYTLLNAARMQVVRSIFFVVEL